MRRLAVISAALLLCAAAAAQDLETRIADQMKAAPDSVQTVLLDAVAMIESGGFDQALHVLDSLAGKCPGDDAVHYYRGVCAYSLGQSAVAAEGFAAALAIDPSNNWYKEALASAYVSCGEGDKAGELYLDLCSINPRKYRTAYTLTLIADAYRMKREFEKYFGVLEEFACDDTVAPEAKYKYLLACCANFDSRTFAQVTPMIVHLCDTFIKAHPYSYDTHNLRMQIAAFTQDYSTMAAECAIMKDLTDDVSVQSDMLGAMADAYYHMGSRKTAYKHYDKAIQLNPGNLSALNNYAYFLCLEGRRLRKAEKMSLATVTGEPDNATYLDTYGWILHLLGRDREAKPYFKHAMIYGGKDSATILSHYAEVLEALGEKDLAKYYRSLAEKK